MHLESTVCGQDLPPRGPVGIRLPGYSCLVANLRPQPNLGIVAASEDRIVSNEYEALGCSLRSVNTRRMKGARSALISFRAVTNQRSGWFNAFVSCTVKRA